MRRPFGLHAGERGLCGDRLLLSRSSTGPGVAPRNPAVSPTAHGRRAEPPSFLRRIAGLASSSSTLALSSRKLHTVHAVTLRIGAYSVVFWRGGSRTGVPTTSSPSSSREGLSCGLVSRAIPRS
eukprot:3837921-Prymnesium_polylepis.2